MKKRGMSNSEHAMMGLFLSNQSEALVEMYIPLARVRYGKKSSQAKALEELLEVLDSARYMMDATLAREAKDGIAIWAYFGQQSLSVQPHELREKFEKWKREDEK